MLGKRAMQSMIFELRMRAGIDFEDPSLTLGKVFRGLVQIYGRQTAEIIMEDVILKIEEIASKKPSSR